MLSHDSARKAVQLGYKKVYVFGAGYPAWEKIAGTATAKAAPTIPSGKEEGTIDPEYLEKILKDNPQSVFLIDVRKPAEYEAGHFKTAVNMPVNEVQKKGATLSTEKPIVFVCNTGALAGESYYLMKDMRPQEKNIFYLDAPVQYNKDGSYTITKKK